MCVLSSFAFIISGVTNTFNIIDTRHTNIYYQHYFRLKVKPFLMSENMSGIKVVVRACHVWELSVGGGGGGKRGRTLERGIVNDVLLVIVIGWHTRPTISRGSS